MLRIAGHAKYDRNLALNSDYDSNSASKDSPKACHWRLHKLKHIGKHSKRRVRPTNGWNCSPHCFFGTCECLNTALSKLSNSWWALYLQESPEVWPRHGPHLPPSLLQYRQSFHLQREAGGWVHLVHAFREVYILCVVSLNWGMRIWWLEATCINVMYVVSYVL